jgi:MoxR-like ATPase
MLKIFVDYPTREQEIAIIKRATTAYVSKTGQILTAEKILALQELVRKVPVGEHVYEFGADLVRKSRPARGKINDSIGQMVSWGAGPRAGIFLLLAAKARAVLHGRYHATTDDVVAMALPVLRHRLVLSFAGEAAGETPDHIIRRLVAETTAEYRSAPSGRATTLPPPLLKDGRDTQVARARK